MNNKPDVKYILEDTSGNKFKIIDTQKVDLQEELNKDIVKQAKEIERLNSIIKEVRELCLMFASGRLERTNYDDILEILDKENSNENN